MSYSSTYTSTDVDPTDGTIYVRYKKFDGYDRYSYYKIEVDGPEALLKDLKAAIVKSTTIRKEKARKEIIQLTSKKEQLEKDLKEAENDLKTLNMSSK